MKSPVKVSILSITYNQSNYIREALDSFLMQKTNFKFEVIIHDDASTDGTKEILEEYQNKHPEIIKPIYEKENQYSKKNFEFITDMYKAAHGDYIAFCEGDDFWTDASKLQTQLDYMEKNPEASLCFHQTRVFFEKGEDKDLIWPDKNKEITKNRLLVENFIPTNSVLYRRQNYSMFRSDVLPGDWYSHLYHAQFGDIHFIDKVMSAYRRHEGGEWWDSYEKPHKLQIKHGVKFLALDKEVARMYGERKEYKKAVEDRIYNDVSSLAQVDIDHGTELISEVAAKYPEFISLYSRRVLAEANKYKPLLEQKEIVDEQIEVLSGETEERQSIIVELNKQINYYRDRLGLIENSRTWRFRNKIEGIFGRGSNER